MSETDRKNVKAIVEAGEIQYFSSDYFREQGKLAYKRKLKKYGKKGLSEIARKAWITKKAKKSQES